MVQRQLNSHVRLFLGVPLLGLLLLVSSSVLQKLYLGVPIHNWAGYITPAVFGIVAGILIAFWFDRSRRNLTLAVESASAFEHLSRQHEMLLQSAGDGIYGIDPGGYCTFINRAALDMLGYREDDVLGSDVHALIHHSSVDGSPFNREECRIHHGIVSHLAVNVENDMLWHKDGTSITVDYSAHPLGTAGSEGVVVVVRNVSAQREMQEQICFMTAHDLLTGLLNRQTFDQRVAAAVDAARTDRTQHVLCYVDLNNFRVINDTVGHEAGDALLGAVAGLLTSQMRQGDVVARLGGDEFGLLFYHCPRQNTDQIVGELLAAVERFRFDWQGQTLGINVGIGVYPVDGNSGDAISALQGAHKVCLLAKESGHNKYLQFDRGDPAYHDLHDQMSWVARIQRALNDGRLFLRHQRIEPLPLGHGGQPALEVLIGMVDENGKTIGPGGFLPAAENYGLIPVIDRWVLGRTFDWLESNPDQLAGLDFVSINVAGPSFGDDEFLGFVGEQLNRRDLPVDKVCFEITETAAIRNLSRVATFMREIKRLGCRFALDDFGSGMSSFGYLKNLPVDSIKIDGSFMREVQSAPLARAIIESIHHVSQAVGIRTVAEHVEDQETVDAFQAIGIDFVQGYAVHRPEPLN